jgi:urea transport system permease protein
MSAFASFSRFLRCLASRCLALLLLPLALFAADIPASLNALGSEDGDARRAAIVDLGNSREPRLVAFLEAYQQGSAYRWTDRIILVTDNTDPAKLLDPLTREVVATVPRSELVELDVGRRERNAARDAITILRLADPDPVARLAAVIRAGDSGGDTNGKALVAIRDGETDAKILRAIDEGIALVALSTGDAPAKLAAAKSLGELRSARALDALRIAAKSDDAPLKSAATTAISAIESRQGILRATQTLFSGLSAGSILIIMALSLIHI